MDLPPIIFELHLQLSSTRGSPFFHVCSSLYRLQISSRQAVMDRKFLGLCKPQEGSKPCPTKAHVQGLTHSLLSIPCARSCSAPPRHNCAVVSALGSAHDGRNPCLCDCGLNGILTVCTGQKGSQSHSLRSVYNQPVCAGMTAPSS